MTEIAPPAFVNRKVHEVGNLVAAVVTETPAQADAVTVDYEALAEVTGLRPVVERGAPRCRSSSAQVFEIERGNRLKTEAATASARRVVDLRLERDRLSMTYTHQIPISLTGMPHGAAADCHKHHAVAGPHPLGVLHAINMSYTIIDSPDEISLTLRFDRQTRSVSGRLLTRDLLRGSRR
jgi:hypothetical protein